MSEEINIELLGTSSEEAEEVTSLIKRVINDFNRSDFTKEGFTNFYEFACEEMFTNHPEIGFVMFKAMDTKLKKMVGMISMSIQDNLLNLFFVSKSYQKRGIGKRLFNRILKETNPELKVMDVESSSYAVKIYEKLGFKKVSEEKLEKDGIHFYKMRKTL